MYLTFTIVSILVIWFNTDAIIEYGSLNRFLKNILKIDQYQTAKKLDCTIEYHQFLLMNYNNFFMRLITCPICFTLWLSIFSFLVGFIYLFEIPMIFIISLILYYLIKKLSL